MCVSTGPPSAICLCLPLCKSVICSTSLCTAPNTPHPTPAPLSGTHPWAYFCYLTQRNSVNLSQQTRLGSGRRGMFGRRVFNTYFHALFVACFCSLVFSIDAPRLHQPVCLFLSSSCDVFVRRYSFLALYLRGHALQSLTIELGRLAHVCWPPDMVLIRSFIAKSSPFLTENSFPGPKPPAEARKLLCF